MRIVYLFRSLAVWGGIERILADKMNQLVTDYGYDVWLLTTDQGEHPVTYHLEKGVHHVDLDIRFHQQYQYHGLQRLLVSRRLRRLFEHRLSEHLRDIRPDVIVCTTANYADIASIGRLKGNVPLVVESHSICQRTLGHGRSHLAKQWNRHQYLQAIAKANVMVALTEGDAADWRNYHPSVRVIPNMVNLNEETCSTLTQKRVIFVGRLDYQKRPMEALRIWQEVWPKHPDWQLDIYGEGEQQQVLEATAGALNMNIHVHRPTSAIFDCYRDSSILMSTSLFEPFGLVIPEAMSCGVPVVAYDCPFGPSSLITDGENGFLVARDDRQAFSIRMNQLMTDAEVRQQMGRKAIESAKRFSATQVMPLWHQLFEEISKMNRNYHN